MKERGNGGSRKNAGSAYKIKLRGRDGAPMSMRELRQGLFDIVRELERYEAYRAKWATLYLTLVDEDGNEIRIDTRGERILYPYKSIADEKGL
ncbi:hypothetical protein AUC70_05850 [Methyloceanibacter stevinii]|uniref:Uncharacterized protein n=2 Tax=Methyloceanibacter stevinii TaxID=1774970 RepID=A0A1E3VPA4_9HYPH|nr:hypothetical protein AUC70_05850 [Methyloceanibacter stevinii]